MATRGYIRIYNVLLCLFLFGAGTISYSLADTLYLKNGQIIEGIVKSQEPDSIELEVCGGQVKFSRTEVAALTRSSSQESEALKQGWKKQIDALKNKIARQALEEARRPKEIAMVNKGQGVMVKARLNHKVDALLVLDTGASFVVIRKKIADELGIKSDNVKPDTKLKLADGRQVKGRYVVLDSVKVQTYEAKNVEAAVLLDEAGAMDFGDGLLGMSFLSHFKFTVDQKNRKVTLERSE